MMDDEVVSEFLVESYENLDALDREFVALESEPDDRERIAAIFRTIHTIKGTSGFLSLTKLETLTHAGESLLGRLRDGTLRLTPEITSALLAMVDAVRVILDHFGRTRTEGDADHGPLVERLRQLQSGNAATPAAPPPAAGVATPLVAAAPPPVVAAPAAALAAVAPPPPSAGPASLKGSPTAAVAEHEGDEAPAEARGATIVEAAVRVNVGLLDKLMNLVGELVLARNQILQVGAASADPAFVGASQRLNLLTTELQEGVMKTRMQPIGNVWNKLPRVVRDLAMTCGKHVNVMMEGKETELDRTIIEAIKDPLTHLVRNAIDHGIEAPEVRLAQGKPEAGTLRLRAFHEGGQVNIEISDDGGGLDPDAIRAKAIERGLISAERASRLGPGEVVNFIFLPGFSTARAVTNVSGRGVGMDVVKTNIERIGGTVDVQSRRGEGTTLRIKIPLTLAIIPALIVSSGGERYAIPQVSLLELVRVEGDRAGSGVGSVQGAPVYKLRGNLLPLVFLDRVLGLQRGEREGGPEALNIMVLQADGRQFGLVVDGVHDTEEIVVKPLGKELKGVTAFAGATIMGDGHVALILDVVGLAQRAGITSGGRDRARPNRASTGQAEGANLETLLLFRVGGCRLALPLSMVARLEEFPRERLERAGRRQVVQYRGEILPVIDLASYIEGGREPDEGATEGADETLKVIVYSEQGKSIGLAVGRILDVIEESVAMKRGVAQKGVLGASVVQGKVTDMLDVHGVIRAADPTFFERRSAS